MMGTALDNPFQMKYSLLDLAILFLKRRKWHGFIYYLERATPEIIS